MKLFCTILFFILFNWLNAQTNIELIGHIDYQSLHQANLNDVWGYVDEFGNEYAIVGTSKGTSIVDVSTPSEPVEVFWIPGSESIWRDPCVYGDYAFVTTEAEDGLTIIDLSPLPSSTVLPTTIYTGTPGSEWQSAHTCFVDENGVAYIFGSNRGQGGAIMLDVHTDPMNPSELGVFDNWYVHDGFVRNDTMYLAHINDGFFSIVDVADKSNPILVGTKHTPNNFTHNIWPSADGQFVFTTDEVAGSYITAYSIADPANIVEVDRSKLSQNQALIPHNTHVKGNYLITSYYSEGITIHDISNPSRIILVGQYDTYPGQSSSFDGCWGVYPFLPSETLLAADITEGLFILDPTYKKACYLEGTITDAVTNSPIDQVSVKISANELADFSNATGAYSSGIYEEGVATVSYSKIGYYPQTIQLNLFQALVQVQDIQLVPIPPYPLTVTVTEAGTGNPIQDVEVLLVASLVEHEGQTNFSGEENFTLYYQEEYTVIAGKWGYFTSCIDQIIDENTGTISIEMSPGYMDEFTFDFGWTVAGIASTGVWERGIPNVTNSPSAPGDDAPHDCGKRAYVTGNMQTMNSDLDDVDFGDTRLTSPQMDLTTYADPYLNYAKWFYCYFGATPDDSLEVILSNGITSVTIEKTGSNGNAPVNWQPVSIRIQDYIPITSSMTVKFNVSDWDPGVNITEAGVDYFYISNGSTLQLQEDKQSLISISPNPFSQELNIAGLDSAKEYVIYNLNGQTIQQGHVGSDYSKIETVKLQNGVYFVKVGERIFKVMKD